jgi:hypothetical protein
MYSCRQQRAKPNDIVPQAIKEQFAAAGKPGCAHRDDHASPSTGVRPLFIGRVIRLLLKCVFDPNRGDSGAQGADPAGVGAEPFQATSQKSVCARIAFNVLTNYFIYRIVVTIRMASRNALSGFRRSSQVARAAARDSGIRDKTMGRKRKSSGAPLFLPAPNRRRGRIAENDMSIAGYVLKAAKAARDGLPGRAVGPGDIIVGDRPG